MSDVRVQVRFRNDLLQRLVDDHPLPLYKLAEEIGVPYGWIISIKSMKRTPYGHNREEYSDIAKRAAAYFNVTPEVLFPPEIYRISWPSKLEKSFPAERIACLIQSDDQRRRALPPHEEMEEREKLEILDKMLKTLTPREEKILRMRFGLDEDCGPSSIYEVGEEFEVTGSRILQIQAKALRKMRDLSRSRKLREVLMGVKDRNGKGDEDPREFFLAGRQDEELRRKKIAETRAKRPRAYKVQEPAQGIKRRKKTRRKRKSIASTEAKESQKEILARERKQREEAIAEYHRKREEEWCKIRKRIECSELAVQWFESKRKSLKADRCPHFDYKTANGEHWRDTEDMICLDCRGEFRRTPDETLSILLATPVSLVFRWLRNDRLMYFAFLKNCPEELIRAAESWIQNEEKTG